MKTMKSGCGSSALTEAIAFGSVPRGIRIGRALETPVRVGELHEEELVLRRRVVARAAREA